MLRKLSCILLVLCVSAFGIDDGALNGPPVVDSTLHVFTTEGEPTSPILIVQIAGTAYRVGTTGGNAVGPPKILYSITPSGVFNTLWSFTSRGFPAGQLVLFPDRHTINGVIVEGQPNTCGQIWEYNYVTFTMNENLFTFPADGSKGCYHTYASPGVGGGLSRDSSGTIYGAATVSDNNYGGCGNVWRAIGGHFNAGIQILHWFPTNDNGTGCFPLSPPVATTGNTATPVTLYGGTLGVYTEGNFYSLTQGSFGLPWVYVDLHEMGLSSDGAGVTSVPVVDYNGDVYDITNGPVVGGSGCVGGVGCGTIFRFRPSTGVFTGSFLVLGSGSGYGWDNAIGYGGGNLLWSQIWGGSGVCANFTHSCGHLGRYDVQSGHLYNIYDFTGNTDGALPMYPPVLDPNPGNVVVGITVGSYSCAPSSCAVVYSMLLP